MRHSIMPSRVPGSTIPADVRAMAGHGPSKSQPGFTNGASFCALENLAIRCSTVIPASNPCENGSSPCNAPWPDQAPPIQFAWLQMTRNRKTPSKAGYNSNLVQDYYSKL